MTRRKIALLALNILLVHAVCLIATAADSDWPMWRHDANRSAASPVDLPGKPHLQWKRELPPPRPAFAGDHRLCFDLTYEPVVMGKRIFVPSMVTDSVAAFNTDTGREEWVFYADGPVRFAPIADDGKVYFISDDGHLYCVGASDGKLVWKFSGIPTGREGYRFLCHERLVTRWPARGGPVLDNGTLYFAAGVWPLEGVFVYAVDAKTGKQIWVNRDVGFLKAGLLDHGTRRDGGLSPQGYLAVVAGKLIVPSGRSLPGFFDRKTGEIEPYTTGWGGRDALSKGSWYACGLGGYLFQSGDLYALTPKAASLAGPYEHKEYWDIADFARAAAVSVETVEKWIKKKFLETVERDGKQVIHVPQNPNITFLSWFMGKGLPGEQHVLKSYPRMQVDVGNDKSLDTFREPVLTEDTIYFSQPVDDPGQGRSRWPPSPAYSEIVACDTTKATWGISCETGWGDPPRFVVWRNMRFRRRWNLPSKLKVHIKAGSRLYAGGNGIVAAVDIPGENGKAQVSWKAEIDGMPSRMLAADGKLFVVTREGAIYCFGGKEGTPATLKAEQPLAPAEDKWTERAKEVIKRTGVSEGYCLALGLGTGRLAEELARQSKLRVIVLEPDVKKIDAARRRLAAKGLYGARVHVIPGDLSHLKLTPYFASLIVSEDPKQAGLERGTAFVQSLFAPLRPYGGTACLALTEQEHSAFCQRVKEANCPEAKVERNGNLTLLKHMGALRGATDWTHPDGGAGDGYASGDVRVRPPFGLLWFGGPLDEIQWASPAPVVCGGRMFLRAKNDLHAFDIYTGRPLWKVTVPGFGRIAALEDFVYVTSEGACLRLDPATGSTVGEIAVPGGSKRARWDRIRVWGDYLAGTSGRNLYCVDRRSGKMLWKSQGARDRLGIVAGNGKVFCVDYWSPARKRKGEGKPAECTLSALGAQDGKTLWQTTLKLPEPDPKKTDAKPAHLIPRVAYCDTSDIVLLAAPSAGLKTKMCAHKGETGELLWSKDIPSRRPISWRPYQSPILLPKLFVTDIGEAYDPLTGSALPNRLWKGGLRGCGRALGAPHVVTVRDGYASYVDLATNQHVYLRGVRSGCTNSLIPADGILNAPCFAHHCTCNYSIYVSFAMVHMPDAAAWAPRSPKKKEEKK
ncbi:MAG: PQQ-binding-like beta-propeller repeat protein [Planctomycetes bacterium]|nr:PQQ-binding-like beta-propeller repeat protein [Planctomycetota bacterium]